MRYTSVLCIRFRVLIRAYVYVHVSNTILNDSHFVAHTHTMLNTCILDRSNTVNGDVYIVNSLHRYWRIYLMLAIWWCQKSGALPCTATHFLNTQQHHTTKHDTTHHEHNTNTTQKIQHTQHTTPTHNITHHHTTQRTHHDKTQHHTTTHHTPSQNTATYTTP